MCNSKYYELILYFNIKDWLCLGKESQIFLATTQSLIYSYTYYGNGNYRRSN